MAVDNNYDLYREDIPESEKAKDKYKKIRLDRAEQILKNFDPIRQRMIRLYNKYNGIKDDLSIQWLTHTYGKPNKAPYIAYRLGKTKIDLLNGEFLRMPLVSTITTINSDAVTEKQRQRNFLKGAMLARNEIETIKNVAGVDIMNGMEIPKDESVFESMRFKDKYEDVMQIITNKQTEALDVKKQISQSFLDLEITNYEFFKVELTEEGKVATWPISPVDAIFEYIEGDYYLEKSPILGARQIMSVTQILQRFELTKKERDILYQAAQNPDQYIGQYGRSRGYMKMVGGQLMCDVIHIEWDSVTPIYTKIVPKTKSQLEVDSSTTELIFEMDTEKYESNIEMHNKNVEKGQYKIRTKYMKEKWEATRIGGLIDINMRKVPKKRSVDDPSQILSATYVGYVHGMVNGTTVSLQQVIENFDNLYDIVQYKKNMELAKFSGKALAIDNAGLGKDEKTAERYHKLINHNILEWNSAAEGNHSGRNLDPASMFKDIDFGISTAVDFYMRLEMEIINQIDRITGINDSRQGITAASSTATAQQSDISKSSTITEAFFYGHSGFVKRVIKAIVDKSAISYAFYRTEEAQQVLGDERFNFLLNSMQSPAELAYQDYGIEVEDGSRYMEISRSIDEIMALSINAKTIRPIDVLNVKLAQTVSEKKQFLKNAWDIMKGIEQKMAEQEQQAAAQMQQEQLQTQLQIAHENREDIQNAGKELEVVKGQVQIEVNREDAKNKAMLQSMKTEGDLLLNSQQNFTKS